MASDSGGSFFPFLFILIISELLLQSDSARLKDGDCLDTRGGEWFRTSVPIISESGYGGATENLTVTSATCKASCAAWFMPYAGIQGGELCLCASSSKVERSKSRPEEECLEQSYLTVFYRAPIIRPFTTLSVSALPQIAEVGAPVRVSLRAPAPSAEFRVNFGDGNRLVTSNSSVHHAYASPGTFRIHVFGKPPGAFNWYGKTAETEVTVVSRVSSLGTDLDCPFVVRPGDRTACRVKTSTGQGITIEARFGDRKGGFQAPLPDNVVEEFGGPLVPKYPEYTKVDGLTHSPGVLAVSGIPANKKGHLAGLEIYLDTPGLLDVLVLRRNCSDEEACSYPSGEVLACSPESVFCSFLGKCVLMELASCSERADQSTAQYTVAYRIPLNGENKGYLYLNLNDKLYEILPGDLLAVHQPNEGKVSIARIDQGQRTLVSYDQIVEGELITLDGFDPIENGSLLLRGYVSIPREVHVEHRFGKTGIFKISVKLSGPLAGEPVEKTTEIRVQKPLSGLEIVVRPKDAATNQPVKVEAVLAGGSDFTLLWDFGDGENDTESVRGAAKESYARSHRYPEPGIYQIRVWARNEHGSFVANHTLIAQRPVLPLWTLVTNSPLVLPEPIGINLTYPNDQPLPTNASVQFKFGDGKSETLELPNDSNEEDINLFLYHKYRSAGIFTISAKIFNLVTSYTVSTEVELAKRITGLKVKPLHSAGGNKLIPGFGKYHNHFPLDKEVTFVFKVATGVVELYTAELLDGTLIKNDSEKSFSYKFSEPGYHNLSFFAYNHVQHFTPPVIVGLYMMEPVKGLHVEEHFNVTENEEERYFEITFENVGTDSCMMIEYADGSIPEAFGLESTCFTNFSREVVTFSGPFNDTMFFMHPYPKQGNYTLSVKAFNDVSQSIFNYSFAVPDLSCKPPELAIRNQILDPSEAPEIFRSLPIVQYASAVVRCNATVNSIRSWEILKINETTGKLEEKIDLSEVDSSRKMMLFIKPLFLQRGTYKFKFKVKMLGPPGHTMFPMYKSIFTYVRVIPSPVKVQLGDGSQSRITRGLGQVLQLNPRNYSVDPDDPFNKEFKLTWFCRRVPGEYLNRSLPDEEHTVSEPIWNRTGLLVYDSFLEEIVEEEDRGGCFGKGPGIIKVSSGSDGEADDDGGSIEWPTEVFRRPNVTYEIIVRASLPDRAPSWGGMQLVLLEKVPPSIAIRCQTEKLCYPHDPVGQKINPVRVALIGVCTEHCDGELTYEWSMYGIENDTDIFLPNASQYLFGMYEEKMALSEEFFKEYYPTFGDFSAKLAVSNGDGARGESDLFLHINQPPEGGNCSFSPEAGRALLDSFYAYCQNWTDPEGSDVDYFAYWTKDLNTGTTMYLSYGPDGDAELILPYGSFLVGADIKDEEGALTRINITYLTTSLPTMQEFAAFKQSGQLERVEAAGDQSKFNQLSQAMSSLMKIPLPDEDNNMEPTTMTPDSESQDKELEEAANARLRMVRSVDAVMNMDTLSGLEQIGSALTAIAGEGKGLDNEGKLALIQLLNKTVSLASEIQVEAPQQLLDFCMYAVGTMGGVVARMTEQLIKGVVLPTDRAKAMNYEYDAQLPVYGEDPQEPGLFDGSIPFQEALAKAVIEKEREAAEDQIKTIADLTIRLVLAMLRNIVVGEDPLEFIAPSGLGLTITMFRGGGLSNASIQHGDALYVFPDVCDILSEKGCIGNETLGVMAVSWPAILESFGGGVDLLSSDSQTLQLQLLDEDMNILKISNSSGWFTIIVPRKGESTGAGENDTLSSDGLPEPTYVVPNLKPYEDMVYHQVIVDKADSAANIEIQPTNPSADLLIYIKHRSKPLLHRYDLMVPLRSLTPNANGTYELFLSNDVIQNRTGFFYIGVAEVNGSSSELLDPTMSSLFYEDSSLNLTRIEVTQQFSTNYSLRIFTSGCYFFNYDLKIWSGAGCYVADANRALTYCKCNHLTSFGGGFFVMPNTVDFAYVFANAGFADNVTIYMTIIVTLSLFLALLFWARIQDRKDAEKLGATPLPDNNVKDKYLYEMVVFTGDKDAAATDSKVQFILSGDDDETAVRTLSDDKRDLFRRGAIDSFVMAVPRPLGRLNFLRIWHDNKGKGKFRSWFLSFVVVRDVQTGEKFEFICNRWLAVEKDDGAIDRLLPVAGKGEATEFSHLFNLTARKNLSDGHLWFSVFMRPPRSRFTRCQRVGSCMALLYLSMLVNAMWYGQVPSKPGANAFSIGPLSMSPEQIGVGLMANIIVFPPTFLIITLFRKSRLRRLRPNRITEALKKQKHKKYRLPSLSLHLRPSSSSSQQSILLKDMETQEETRRSVRFKDMGLKVKKKKKFLFPWWCRYVAWFLCVACVVVSVFFLWAYGIQFGEEKTRKWITSLLVSFFSSILVTQPVKVFLMAMVFSSLCKSVDTDEDDSEFDEEQLELAPDEEWMHKDHLAPLDERKATYMPPNNEGVSRAREERMKELRMTVIVKEIFSYCFFLWILIVLSYGNRDPSAFYLRNNLRNAFIHGSVDFSEINSADQFWNWTRDVLVPEILVGRWYNGEQPFGLRGFLDDRVNRMMGYGVLRQVRIKPNTCVVEEKVRNLTSVCRGYGNILDEDHASYAPGWLPLSNETSILNRDEYHYRSRKELDGLPFWAQLDVYGGGGYVFPLRGTHESLRREMDRLERSGWVDARTRAVFVEFSVYNAQVNLFGVLTIVAEFPPGGGLVPYYRIDAIRLMRYHQGFGLFVLICELIYVIYTVYFTAREIRNFLRNKKSYFKSYWNIAEVMVISLSYSSIVIYIYRMLITRRILKTFERTHGNGYVKLQYVASVDELFGYLMAFLIFISILKFTRLLRFNKRMGMLYSTLAQCSKDLKSFFVVFTITFLAFVQTFYLIFGISLKKFSSFVTAAETCFTMMQGDFDFHEFYLTAPILGPLLFFIYSLIMSIILLNIFIILIISAFQSVKTDVSKQNNDYEVVDFLFKKIKSFVGLDGGVIAPDDIYVEQPRNTLQEFPEKVDKLLHYINNFYFGGKLDVDGKKALRKIYSEQDSSHAPPPPSLLDWGEIKSDNPK